MKNRFISRKYADAQVTAMGASDEMAKSFDDCINLSLGDPDRTTDELIIDKAFADAKKGHTRYTDFRGDPELRAEISKFYAQEYGLDVADEEIFVTTAGCLGMALALEAVINAGDEVIVQSPYFTPYPDQIKLVGGVPVELDCLEEEDWQINAERLESLVTPKTKALLINTPSNPTGSCLTKETMEKIARIAEKHDLVVIADDIYTAFSYENPFLPFMSLAGMRERTVTINSFSKNFLMTGWRIGNIVAPAEIVRVIQQINENVAFTSPSISQRGAIHALRHRGEIQPAIVKEYRERTFYAAERVNGIRGFSVIYPPKGTFYLFANIRGTGLDSQAAADKILREAHVLVLPGTAFGRGGEGYIRIACTRSKQELKEAFDRMEKVFNI